MSKSGELRPATGMPGVARMSAGISAGTPATLPATLPAELTGDWREVLARLCVALEDRRLPPDGHEPEVLRHYTTSLKSFVAEVNRFAVLMAAAPVWLPTEIQSAADYRCAFARLQSRLCTLGRQRHWG
jgi:hypothetical protein